MRTSLPVFAVVLASMALPPVAMPAILPDTIGAWLKGAGAPATVADAKTWQEFGLQDSEVAPYAANGKSYTISAWRFTDATGAYAAMDQIRPKDATPIQVTDVGLATATDEYVTVGNYLFVFKGYKPNHEELNHVVGTAPRYAQSRIPSLPKYLPADPLPNSERYILGPASLGAYASAIPPGTAAFHFSAEAVFARYKVKGGEAKVLVFNYPTMEIARTRMASFQAIPGATVKRAGPLVALTLDTPNADDAEKLLSQVRYQAEITVPEHVPTLKDNPANLFLNIIILCGVLAGICVAAGLVVAALRLTIVRSGASGDGDAMISLRISGRQ